MAELLRVIIEWAKNSKWIILLDVRARNDKVWSGLHKRWDIKILPCPFSATKHLIITLFLLSRLKILFWILILPSGVHCSYAYTTYLYSHIVISFSATAVWALWNKPGKPSFGQRWKEHFGITPQTQGKVLSGFMRYQLVSPLPHYRSSSSWNDENPNRPSSLHHDNQHGCWADRKTRWFSWHRYMPIDFSCWPFEVSWKLFSLNRC